MDDQEFSDWKELAESITDADRVRHSPPSQVWDNIQAAVADTNTERVDTELDKIALAEADEDVPHEDVIDLNAALGERAPATARKRRRHMILAAAASVLALLIGLSLLDIGAEPVETLVADITNEALPEAFTGTATATVELDDAPILEIRFDDALPTDEPVELWVIKTDPVAGDIVDMRSLGIVDPDATSWSGDWPSDLDPAEYSVVDLSIEPDDGDPAHSGRSILRGALGSL